MRRERPAGGLSAGEGADLRGRCGLLGRELILGRGSFQLLELKLHLVDQTRLALVARAKQIPFELLDRQPQMHDQRFCARRFGARVRYLGPRLHKLGIACLQQPLQRRDIFGERIIRAHHARWNHKRRVL